MTHINRPSRGRRWWTIKELNEIRALAKEGLSGARIARFLGNGRTPNAVRSLIRRHGIHLKGKGGAPYGNTNNNKSSRLSPEEKRQREIERCRLYRLKKKILKPIPATGTFPFRDHRTISEIDQLESQHDAMV